MMIGLAMITYLDRACIGKLAPDIQRDLSLSKEQMSWVFSAFALAYAIFEMPTAWWADRQGTRGVLARIVLWWSGLTMLTGAAFNYVSMLVVRFLFGAGEAGAWPCMARTFSRWIPSASRGRVQGIFFAGAHFAAFLAPLVAYWLNNIVGWRMVFVIFGALGVVWIAWWLKSFRNEPSEHPGVNAAELALINAGRSQVVESHHGGPGYWKRLFSHRNTIPLCLAYIPNNCTFYFCITWLPTYLQEKHQFDALKLGFFSGLPFLTAVIGDVSGGAVTDWATRRFGLRIGRAGVTATANIVAGIAMVSATQASNPVLAICLISLAVTATMFTLASTWATCQDIGGRHTGMVGATMNTAGQIGAIASPPLVTYLLAKFGDWNAPVAGIGILLFLGAFLWIFINPRDKIFE